MAFIRLEHFLIVGFLQTCARKRILFLRLGLIIKNVALDWSCVYHCCCVFKISEIDVVEGHFISLKVDNNKNYCEPSWMLREAATSCPQQS